MAACRPLTNYEIMKLRDSMTSPRDRLWLAIGVLSGFRISELLSIKVSDVIDYDGTVKEHLTVQRKNMKRKTKSRTVEIGDISDILNPWLKVMERWGFMSMRDYLFINPNGEPINRNTAYDIIKLHSKRCFIKTTDLGVIGTHSMRKTFARNMHVKHLKIDPGNALIMTRDALGHVSVASTEKYLRSCFCSKAARAASREHQAEMLNIFVKPTSTQSPATPSPKEPTNDNTCYP